MLTLNDQEREIFRVTNEISNLETTRYSSRLDIERLADRYKERGDRSINLYRDTYAVNKSVRGELADNAFRDYEKAIDLFKNIGNDMKRIYSTMALGNACKERFLPNMAKNTFDELEKAARDKYEECVDFYFQDMDKHAQQYYFIMLEQINLTVRKNVWSKGLLPKRVVVFHSLKSPESHMCLEGICYFAFRSNCEIWEYRFGKVKTFDEEKKFIKDRLYEASAIVFLASEDYNQKSQIVKFEVDTAIAMKAANDPILVLAVDLGNHELLSRIGSISRIFPAEDLETIFIQKYDEIQDVYHCRHFRCSK
jgi:hypothetical protein